MKMNIKKWVQKVALVAGIGTAGFGFGYMSNQPEVIEASNAKPVQEVQEEVVQNTEQPSKEISQNDIQSSNLDSIVKSNTEKFQLNTTKTPAVFVEKAMTVTKMNAKVPTIVTKKNEEIVAKAVQTNSSVEEAAKPNISVEKIAEAIAPSVPVISTPVVEEIKEIEKKPSTIVSFVDEDGKKIEKAFEGNIEEFSNMFIFDKATADWKPLSKKEALKVNPYADRNWTRDGLIKEAMAFEAIGVPKKQAWSKYYEYQAKFEPALYEVVDGYWVPNKEYFASLATSSLSASKQAEMNGDKETADIWLKRTKELLVDYKNAPGMNSYLIGINNNAELAAEWDVPMEDKEWTNSKWNDPSVRSKGIFSKPVVTEAVSTQANVTEVAPAETNVAEAVSTQTNVSEAVSTETNVAEVASIEQINTQTPEVAASLVQEVTNELEETVSDEVLVEDLQ